MISLVRSIWHYLCDHPTEYHTGNRRRSNFRAWWKDNRGWVFLWSYCAIGLYTFGYDATHHPQYSYQTYSEVEDHRPKEVNTANTGFISGIAGLLWPGFWVWEEMS